jgi:methylated-DNA-protein-cysteine methyltransferase-like protein
VRRSVLLIAQGAQRLVVRARLGAERGGHPHLDLREQVAAIVGGGCDARTVGYALNEIPADRPTVPWQRIINRQGGISTRGLAQRELLEAEGVAFDAQGHVIMSRFRWPGPSAEWAAAYGCNTLPPRDDAEQLSMF